MIRKLINDIRRNRETRWLDEACEFALLSDYEQLRQVIQSYGVTPPPPLREANWKDKSGRLEKSYSTRDRIHSTTSATQV